MGLWIPIVVLGATLDISSYLGGTGSETLRGIATDSTGNILVVGQTNSTDFPTINGAQMMSGGGQDAFIAKFNPAGNTRIWATYLGGSGIENGFEITADAAGDVYVTGETASANFPRTTGQAFGGGTDAFVAKYSAAGAKIWATYLGGASTDRPRGIGVDSAGAVFVAGFTLSSDFPTTAGALDQSFGGNTLDDAFVTKLAADGSAPVWSTFLGGAAADRARDMAVDAAGNVYVTGETASGDFPLVSAFDSTLTGVDAFVSKINAGGATLAWSSYLGGNLEDVGQAVSLAPGGGVVVAGDTVSSDFPGAAGLDASFNGGAHDAFVARILDTPALSWSTYLGGTADDQARSIGVDLAGNSVVGGFTTSVDFPLSNAFDTRFVHQEGFLSTVNAAGTALVWSSYLGGSDTTGGGAAATALDSVNGSSVNASGTLALAGGNTNSAYFPYPSKPGFDKQLNGPSDGFFAVVSNVTTTALRVEELTASRRDGRAQISWRLVDPAAVAEMRVLALENGSERLVSTEFPDPLDDAYEVTDPVSHGGPWALDVVTDASNVERYGPVSLSLPMDPGVGCGAGSSGLLGVCLLGLFVRRRGGQRDRERGRDRSRVPVTRRNPKSTRKRAISSR